MPHIPTTWVPLVTELKSEYFNNMEDSLVAARSVKATPGTYTLATVIVNEEGYVIGISDGTPGAVANASTSIKGAALASVTPADPLNPKFVGDNDPRVQAATTTQRAVLKASATGSDVALVTSDPTFETRIEGLALSRPSSTQVAISPGCAWIPTSSQVLNVPSTITLTPTLSANAWFYVYLLSSGGVAAGECVTTAPSAVYKGTARTKTGDTSRRFVGVIRTDGSSNIYNFTHVGDRIRYLTSSLFSPFRVLSAGSATTATPISCANVIPPITQSGIMRFANTITGFAYMYNADLGTVSSTVNFYDVPTVAFIDPFYPLSSAQAFSYVVSSGSAQFYADVLGYNLPR